MHQLRWLAGSLGLVLGLARAEPPPAPARVAADQLVQVENFDANLLAREIFRESNAVRLGHRLAPFKSEVRLAAAASGQAAMLALRIHGGHQSPLPNQADPGARVRQAGLPPGQVAENAATLNAKNRETGNDYTYAELATVIVQAWMGSPGHRANLLDPKLHYLGCGTRVAFMLRGQPVVYAIQDFYTPAPSHERAMESPTPAMMPADTHRTR